MKCKHLIFISIIFLSIQLVSADTVFDSGLKNGNPYIEKGTANNKFYVERIDNEFAGRRYTPNCLVECHDVLNITPKSKSFNPDSTNDLFAFVNVSESNDNPKLRYEIAKKQTYYETVYEYENVEKCIYLENKTKICETEKKVVGEHEEQRERWYWVELTKNNMGNLINVAKDSYFIIDIVGTRSGTLGKKYTHIIPKINGVEFGELSYWYSSWGECFDMMVPISSDRNIQNELVSINITGLTTTKSPVDEGRVVNAGCGESGSLTNWDFIQNSSGGSSDEWANIVFVFSNTSQSGHQNYSFYSNNPTAISNDSHRIPSGTSSALSHYTNGSALPDVQNDPWTHQASQGTTSIIDDLGGKAINISASRVSAQSEMWQKDWAVGGGAVTFEFAYRVIASKTPQGRIFISYDGDDQLYALANTTAFTNNRDNGENFAVDNTDYHILRVTQKDNNVSVYLDNVYQLNIYQYDTSTDKMWWGCSDGDYWIDANYRYFTFDNTTARPPLVATQGLKQLPPDAIPPQFSGNSTNSTTPNTNCNFTIDVTDETALATGTYIFSTNNTGYWVNHSTVTFVEATTETAWNLTTLNSTGNMTIQWLFYASDNTGNWNTSETFNLTISAVATTTTTVPQIDYCQLLWVQQNKISNDNECVGNDTLRHNLTYNVGGNITFIYTYERCNWGCDNSTHSCYPSPLKQNLYMAGIVLLISFILIFIPVKLKG